MLATLLQAVNHTFSMKSKTWQLRHSFEQPACELSISPPVPTGSYTFYYPCQPRIDAVLPMTTL